MLFEVRLWFSSYSNKSAGVCVCVYWPFSRCLGVRVHVYKYACVCVCVFMCFQYIIPVSHCAPQWCVLCVHIGTWCNFRIVKALKWRWHFGRTCIVTSNLFFPITFHKMCFWVILCVVWLLQLLLIFKHLTLLYMPQCHMPNTEYKLWSLLYVIVFPYRMENNTEKF